MIQEIERTAAWKGLKRETNHLSWSECRRLATMFGILRFMNVTELFIFFQACHNNPGTVTIEAQLLTTTPRNYKKKYVSAYRNRTNVESLPQAYYYRDFHTKDNYIDVSPTQYQMRTSTGSTNRKQPNHKKSSSTATTWKANEGTSKLSGLSFSGFLDLIGLLTILVGRRSGDSDSISMSIAHKRRNETSDDLGTPSMYLNLFFFRIHTTDAMKKLIIDDVHVHGFFSSVKSTILKFRQRCMHIEHTRIKEMNDRDLQLIQSCFE